MAGAPVPETHYARTPDGVSLAYHIVGDGPVDLREARLVCPGDPTRHAGDRPVRSRDDAPRPRDAGPRYRGRARRRRVALDRGSRIRARRTRCGAVRGDVPRTNASRGAM